MMRRLPSAFMVLSYALYTIIGTHYLLDDLDVTTATSEKLHTGSAFFIVIDVLCVTVSIAGIALFMSLFLGGKGSSTSSAPLPWRLAS